MELRQLRSFVRVVELGSISRAAQGLGMAQSALSQQIGRLESELATRLLQRSPFGVAPSEAGVAFYREAQLTLRHAEQAVRSAQQARLSGSVSIGLAPTTAAMLGLPLMQAMRARYPQVRLHMVESLSGHLASLLHARELDLAVLFDTRQAAPAQRHWGRHPLLEEDLFFICSKTQGKAPRGRARRMLLSDLGDTPLILPTGPHGLRSTLDAAFARAGVIARVDLEIDSLTMLMEAVDAGLGATLQPWAATRRFADADTRFRMVRIEDAQLKRVNTLCTLPEDELSPVALAARVVLLDCARTLVRTGHWTGAQALAH
jgi:LysR family transcriptional regulator, regulatory protein for tcuABC